MKRVVTVLGGLTLVIVVLACTWSWADAAPPAPPQNLRIVPSGTLGAEGPSTLPLIYITLEWDANAEPDLAGYIIYRGSLPGFPVGPGSLLQDVGPDTTFTDNSMETGETYAWKVTAYNGLAEESGPSNEVVYSPPVSVENATWGNIKALYRW